jgi:hypothetical protein
MDPSTQPLGTDPPTGRFGRSNESDYVIPPPIALNGVLQTRFGGVAEFSPLTSGPSDGRIVRF